MVASAACESAAGSIGSAWWAVARRAGSSQRSGVGEEDSVVAGLAQMDSQAVVRAINPGESPDEQFVRWNRDQISSPLAGTFSVVVLGGKGGVGKTSSTVVIGSTFAALRPREQVIALDADPGQGANLAVRIDRSASSSYGDIVAAKDLVRYSDVRARWGTTNWA